jgi:hypothetical protein
MLQYSVTKSSKVYEDATQCSLGDHERVKHYGFNKNSSPYRYELYDRYINSDMARSKKDRSPLLRLAVEVAEGRQGD